VRVRWQYVLVVATSVEVFLFAVTFDDDDPDRSIRLTRLREFCTNTDDVQMRKIVGLPNGRIFMAGRDGNVYELEYFNEESSLALILGVSRMFSPPRKCRKLNKSSGALRNYIPTALVNLGMTFSSPLVDMLVDPNRNILYTLSESGGIQLYDLGENGCICKKGQGTTNVFRDAKIWCEGSHTSVPSSTFAEQQSAGFRIISLHLIGSTESRDYNLMAVSNAGFRFYFQVLPPSTLDASVRPDRFLIVDIRLPPDPSIWDDLGRPMQAQGDQKKYPAAFKAPGGQQGASPTDLHKAYYSRGIFLLAQGPEERGRDTVVAICEDHSPKVPGEVVSEVQPPARAEQDRSLGRVWAIAEEPFINFPIALTQTATQPKPKEDDKLRYLVACSATPEAERQSGFAAEFRAMITRDKGLQAQHLYSKFCAPLSELTEQYSSSRMFVILTNQGLYVLSRPRPLDVMWGLLERKRNDHLQYLQNVFGPEEFCAMLFAIASGVACESIPVGRQVLAPPIQMQRERQQGGISDMAWQHLSKGNYGSQVAPAQAYGDRGTQAQQTGTPTLFVGLLKNVGRIIRPVWLKPIVVTEVTTHRMFLQSRELKGVIRPLAHLEELIRTHYPHATKLLPLPLSQPAAPNQSIISISENWRISDTHMAALYRLIKTTLDTLRLLSRLADFESTHPGRLSLENLKDLSVKDIVTSRVNQGTVKGMLSDLVEPADQPDSKDLIDRLGEDCTEFFSHSDRLTFEGQRALSMAEAKRGRTGPTEESTTWTRRASECFIQATYAWRTRNDIERIYGNSRDEPFFMRILQLAPQDHHVLRNLVDMVMLTSHNFLGDPSQIPAPPAPMPGSGPAGNVSGAYAPAYQARLGAYGAAGAPLEAASEAEAIRMRCYDCIVRGIEWLLSRPSQDVAHSFYQQSHYDAFARIMMDRALMYEDPKLHEKLYDFMNQRKRDWLMRVDSQFIESYLARKADRAGELELARYLQYHGRYYEAMNVYQQDAEAEGTSLERRLKSLDGAIESASQCVSRGDNRSGSRMVGKDHLQMLEDQREMGQLQLTILIRLDELRASLPRQLDPAELREFEDVRACLEKRILLPNPVFALCKRLTLWEECLQVSAVCDQGGSTAKECPKHWRNIIYNELPKHDQAGSRLQRWRDEKVRDVKRRWGHDAVGLPNDALRLRDLEAVKDVLNKVKAVARQIEVDKNRKGVAFPMRDICRELQELETQVAMENGRFRSCRTIDPSEWRDLLQNLTWKALKEVGVTHFELVGVYYELLQQRDERLRDPVHFRLFVLHGLYEIMQDWLLTLKRNRGQWAPMLDSSQQRHVVRQLAELAQEDLLLMGGVEGEFRASFERLQTMVGQDLLDKFQRL
jgi:hypothetical protein